MHTLLRTVTAAGLVAIGFVLGASGVLGPARAQEADAKAPSEEAAAKVKAASIAVGDALTILQKDELYKPAINGMNAFVATTGGPIDALADLEGGRGVDPETFAGLYAGLAVDAVAEHLTKDAEGRLLYKSKIVRMYPISRLKTLFEKRSQTSTPATEAAPAN